MFKNGDIVYCIDINSKFSNTTMSSIEKLKLNKPYTILNYNGGNNDILLKEIDNIYYMGRRFISEKEYKIKYRKDKIKKIKERIYG